MAKFGELLRRFRQRADKSMGMVARHIDVSVPYISGVERGIRAPLTNTRIEQVADFLGLDPTETDTLIASAAETRGFFELESSQNQLSQRVGAALARRWASLKKEDLEKIGKIVDGA